MKTLLAAYCIRAVLLFTETGALWNSSAAGERKMNKCAFDCVSDRLKSPPKGFEKTDKRKKKETSQGCLHCSVTFKYVKQH